MRYWVAEYHPAEGMTNIILEQGPLYAFLIRDMAARLLAVIPTIKMPDIVVEGVSLQQKYGDLKKLVKQKITTEMVQWANDHITRTPATEFPRERVEAMLKKGEG